MIEKKGAESGMVLGWMLVLLLAATVWVLGASAAAGGYYKRSHDQLERAQITATVQGLAECMERELSGAGGGAFAEAVRKELGEISLTGEGGEAFLISLGAGWEEDLGDCRIRAWYEEGAGILTVEIEGEKGEQRSRICLVMREGEKGFETVGYRKGGNGADGGTEQEEGA